MSPSLLNAASETPPRSTPLPKPEKERSKKDQSRPLKEEIQLKGKYLV